MSFVDKFGDFAFGLLAWPAILIYQSLFGDGGINCNATIRRAISMEEAAKRAMKERRRNEPRPLPSRRRRLSIAYASKNSKTKTQTFSLWNTNQEEQNAEITPPLFRVPLEIREKIYAEVLGNNILHITQLPKRLGYTRCTASSTNKAHGDPARSCFFPSKVHNYRYGEPMDTDAASDGNVIPLLQTSRQIYSEAESILYRITTFDVNHPQALLFLSQTVPSHRFDSIRYLQLSWTGRLPMSENDPEKRPDDLGTWEKCWEIVGGMKGLRFLRLRLELVHDEGTGEWLRFTRTRWTKDAVQFEIMLENMKAKVRGLRGFGLRIEMPEVMPWPVKDLEDRMRKVICSPSGVEE